tara:strand:+ start:29 stop:274 length:246 start_codon:yes stop_codon:yes gene_type:complete
MKTITYNSKEYTFGNVNENGVERELTDAEAIERAQLNEADVVKSAEWQTMLDAHTTDVASAKTKLEGLGLTVNEVKAAFGI